MGRWSRRLAPLLVDFAGVTRAGRVLDVGCGTGNLSRCLAGNPDIRHICGIDLSSIYVEHARRTNGDLRTTFEVGDACALSFPDASFDHSLSMLALQFAPDVHLAVREMRRVTRPGGTLAAATWDTRGGLVAFRMVFDAAAMLHPRGESQRARNYTRPLSRPGELAGVWEDAGLVDVLQEMRTIRMDFTSFEDFWRPAEGSEGPVAEFVRTLDGADRSKLRNAVRSAYLDGEDDGARSYAATAWVVRGRVP
ncbi:class I SAM-dependent methyltransferase [Bradyrhizobium guangzhouense]|nr:class I SAM-dependent methyltransferase [Bradyrhizobium guangzhouense]